MSNSYFEIMTYSKPQIKLNFNDFSSLYYHIDTHCDPLLAPPLGGGVNKG